MTESYWRRESDSYQYPGSPVLRNLPGIRDHLALEVFERRATALRLDEVFRAVCDYPITFALWTTIHRLLFQDVYEWAGAIRTVQLAKGNTVFAMPENIAAEGRRIFASFRDEDLALLDRNQFISRLAYYYGELNVLHPFREGNGRTQKLLFEEIARRHGYMLAWPNIDVDDLLRALITAYFEQDYQLLESLFLKALTDNDPE
jgi:cell filamentation protein